MDWPPGRKAVPTTISLGWRRTPLSEVSCRLQAARFDRAGPLEFGIVRGSHLQGMSQPEQPAVDLAALAEGQAPVDRQVRRQTLGASALLIGLAGVIHGESALLLGPILLPSDHRIVDRQGGHRGGNQDERAVTAGLWFLAHRSKRSAIGSR